MLFHCSYPLQFICLALSFQRKKRLCRMNSINFKTYGMLESGDDLKVIIFVWLSEETWATSWKTQKQSEIFHKIMNVDIQVDAIPCVLGCLLLGVLVIFGPTELSARKFYLSQHMLRFISNVTINKIRKNKLFLFLSH